MDLHDLIEQTAYQIYVEKGKIEGRDLDNWLEAERIVHSQHQGQETHESGSHS